MAPYLSLAEIPTVSLLYKLRRLVPDAHSLKSPSKALNETISLIRHDITKLEGVDCIVNAANERCMGGGGVDGAIHRAAGLKLLEECRTLNGCATGDAKITYAYNLPNKRIIHTVGPIYNSAKREAAEELLRSCYRRSLELAVEYDMKSIAFSALSTGVYGYPPKDAARTALDETRKFLEVESNIGRLERVIFCNFEFKDEKAYEELIPLYFPFVEQQQPGTGSSSNESASPGTLAAALPDPPTADPKLDGQPDSKKQKLSASGAEIGDAGSQTDHAALLADDRSDEEWEEIKKLEDRRAESLDDEPVEVDRPASVTDVQSVQSSGIIDDMVHSQSTDGFLGKD
ncbi:hypothetical protein BDV18DRAFT_129971 [Aspergillus unguis]